LIIRLQTPRQEGALELAQERGEQKGGEVRRGPWRGRLVNCSNFVQGKCLDLQLCKNCVSKITTVENDHSDRLCRITIVVDNSGDKMRKAWIGLGD